MSLYLISNSNKHTQQQEAYKFKAMKKVSSNCNLNKYMTNTHERIRSTAAGTTSVLGNVLLAANVFSVKGPLSHL